jgi:cell division GTPase FtsZ
MMSDDKDKMKESLAAARGDKPRMRNVAASLSPRARKRVEKDLVVTDTFDHDVAMRMAFLGAGQGGGRIADAFWRLGYRRVSVFNTTDMDFAELDDGIKKHSLDTGGAAKDTELARQALTGREEEVRDLLAESWGSEFDCAMVCVSLGGGTGSGTAAKLVQVARQYMKDKTGQERVGALVSLPTLTEGYAVNRNAVNGFRALIELEVSPLLIIDNVKVNQLFKPPMSKLHATANDTITTLFHLFNQLAAVRADFTFDRSEFAQLLDAGIMAMGAADIQEIESPSDISTAIRDEMTNNVLAQVDLRTGKKGACLFVASQDVLDELSLDYFDAGFGQLDRLLGSVDGEETAETIVHRGLYVGDDPGLQCYTIVSELGLPRARLSEMARVGGLADGSGRSAIASWLGVDD